MKVRELIEVLKNFPQELDVAYYIYSECALLKPDDLAIVDACLPREDGWVHRARPDKPTQKYLMFPGS